MRLVRMLRCLLSGHELPNVTAVSSGLRILAKQCKRCGARVEVV